MVEQLGILWCTYISTYSEIINKIDVSGEYQVIKEENGYYISSYQEDDIAEYHYTAYISEEELEEAKNDVLELPEHRLENNQTIFDENYGLCEGAIRCREINMENIRRIRDGIRVL